MCSFANTGFIGIPIVLELYGKEGMLYAVIYNMFYQLFFFSYGIAMLSGDGRFRLKDAWNPCIQSALLAILLFLLPVDLPGPVQDTVETIGAMVVPLSMMIIGFGLSDIRFRDIFCDSKAYAVSLMRLIVFPVLDYVMFYKPWNFNLEAGWFVLIALGVLIIATGIFDTFRCMKEYKDEQIRIYGENAFKKKAKAPKKAEE